MTKIGSTIQSLQLKRYCFTLNNWSEQELQDIVLWMKKDKYIIGKEIGENDTPHLQGHVEFIKAKRLTELKKFNPRIHWEKTRNNIASMDYCKKDGDYITNIRFPREIIFPEFNLDWQVKILDIIKEVPDNRTIHWIVDKQGLSGKTTFTKYLKIYHNAVECPAKSSDAFHRIAKLFDAHTPIDLCLFDFPRSSMHFINYGTIEKIKDGNVCSGKYEGSDCVFACPHVIVFANELPDFTQMSMDRWKVHEI